MIKNYLYFIIIVISIDLYYQIGHNLGMAFQIKVESTASSRTAGNQSAWATPALRWAVETELFYGMPIRYNFPYQDADKVATRAQVAALLDNAK